MHQFSWILKPELHALPLANLSLAKPLSVTPNGHPFIIPYVASSQEPLPCILLQLVSETFQRWETPHLWGSPFTCVCSISIISQVKSGNQSSYNFFHGSWLNFWEHSKHVSCMLDMTLDTYESWKPSLKSPTKASRIERNRIGQEEPKKQPLKYQNARLYWLKSSCH